MVPSNSHKYQQASIRVEGVKIKNKVLNKSKVQVNTTTITSK